jgi:hypothetical protein
MGRFLASNVIKGERAFKAATMSALALLTLFFTGIVVSMVTYTDWDTLFSTLMSQEILFAIRLSLITATISTILSISVAIPVAYAISQIEFPGKDIVDILGHGLVEAVCAGIPIILPYQSDMVKRIALFPRDIYVSTSKPPGPAVNRFKGIVTEIKPFSSLMRLKVTVGENNLLAELPKDIFEDMRIKIGQEIFLILFLITQPPSYELI